MPKKKINLKAVDNDNFLSIPQFKMVKSVLPIDSISIPPLKGQEVHYFLINDPKTIKRLGNSVEFERNEFLRIVTTEVLKQCKYLAYARHFVKIKNMIDKFLINSGFAENIVKLDPAKVIAHVKDCLDLLNKQLKVSYERLDEDQRMDLNAIQISVPETFEHPNDNAMLHTEWSNKKHKGIPFGGWTRCRYVAVPFDTGTEYHIATIIDTADEVKSWFRNLPGILTLITPVGYYSPDFAILLKLNDKNILLELKDDDRFGRDDQDATIKAKAATSWCQAISSATAESWEYRILLDSDAKDCETFDDIMNYSETVDEE